MIDKQENGIASQRRTLQYYVLSSASISEGAGRPNPSNIFDIIAKFTNIFVEAPKP